MKEMLTYDVAMDRLLIRHDGIDKISTHRISGKGNMMKKLKKARIKSREALSDKTPIEYVSLNSMNKPNWWEGES